MIFSEQFYKTTKQYYELKEISDKNKTRLKYAAGTFAGAAAIGGAAYAAKKGKLPFFKKKAAEQAKEATKKATPQQIKDAPARLGRIDKKIGALKDNSSRLNQKIAEAKKWKQTAKTPNEADLWNNRISQLQAQKSNIDQQILKLNSTNKPKVQRLIKQ